MNERLNILLTNDDGFAAPGIKLLFDHMKSECDITVVAPDAEQSGVGHAFTFSKPLHYKQDEIKGMNGFRVNGTPSDCVKFAISFLLAQRPDAVVSGMNLGENSGLSAYYSGTVAAAREGSFWGIPSFAFSVCNESVKYASEYAAMALPIMKSLLKSVHDNECPRMKNTFFNVNFPICAPKDVRGTKITWQSNAYFDDRYEKVEVETGTGYMIYGEKKDIERSDAFDSRALMEGFITITPLSFDATAHETIPFLQWLENDNAWSKGVL